VVKIYFQPGVDIRTATAQVTSISQTACARCRRHDPAADHQLQRLDRADPAAGPVEQDLAGTEAVRPQPEHHPSQPVSVPGAAIPRPYGGKERQIVLDLDPARPAGATACRPRTSRPPSPPRPRTPRSVRPRSATFQYNVWRSTTPPRRSRTSTTCRSTVGGATIFVRDIGHVRDGSAPQTNVVHVDGKRAVLMTILKAGSTSTIAIVDGVKAACQAWQAILPPDSTSPR
jgi:hypothetical protein